jgi:hypothetical protein
MKTQTGEYSVWVLVLYEWAHGVTRGAQEVPVTSVIVVGTEKGATVATTVEAHRSRTPKINPNNGFT